MIYVRLVEMWVVNIVPISLYYRIVHNLAAQPPTLDPALSCPSFSLIVEPLLIVLLVYSCMTLCNRTGPWDCMKQRRLQTLVAKPSPENQQSVTGHNKYSLRFVKIINSCYYRSIYRFVILPSKIWYFDGINATVRHSVLLYAEPMHAQCKMQTSMTSKQNPVVKRRWVPIWQRNLPKDGKSFVFKTKKYSYSSSTVVLCPVCIQSSASRVTYAITHMFDAGRRTLDRGQS